MSRSIVLEVGSPMKGDIVLTLRGHRRLWDGRHWRALCRISDCKAQRQVEFNKLQYKRLSFQFSSLSSNVKQQEQKQVISVGHNKEKNKKSKCRDLNVIINELRRSQTISETYSIE
ncbi:unnamed protein product [Rotaria magnacalcarata]|uniref:Uncharacterized protein n=1 Tax=Rotaria magnacalcarata TaxID=392030 RepID=A0A816NG53_9BILA|nr:unnamed protein product [Rotaria magnacalcarata]CAF2269066.1 unnamed protein product [Rotaria magnacalcarata]